MLFGFSTAGIYNRVLLLLRKNSMSGTVVQQEDFVLHGFVFPLEKESCILTSPIGKSKSFFIEENLFNFFP